MNFGKTIQELRKRKNVTQEDMAAELGVTAAAVSKWENNYTLPDILMLCALADYFDVTTDELLGRSPNTKYAVLAVTTAELGAKIKELALQYGVTVKTVCFTYSDALTALQADNNYSYFITSLGRPLCDAEEQELEEHTDHVTHVDVDSSDEDKILSGLEIYFKNMDIFDSLSERKIHTIKKVK